MAEQCEHEFHFNIEVSCFEDRKPLAAVDISGGCTKCPAMVEFIGLECGVNLAGAACSPDNREATLAVIITTKPAAIKHSGARVRIN